jgi:hypothetical protein
LIISFLKKSKTHWLMPVKTNSPLNARFCCPATTVQLAGQKHESCREAGGKVKDHITHYACKEVLERDGGKSVGCCCTGHKCKKEK